jgi:hypothetical protein
MIHNTRWFEVISSQALWSKVEQEDIAVKIKIRKWKREISGAHSDESKNGSLVEYSAV